MTPLKVDKYLGILALALLVGAAALASMDVESTSSTRRGQSVEGLFHGLGAIIGLEEPADAGQVWLARLLALAAVAVVGAVVWRKSQRKRQSDPPARPVG